MIKLKDTKWLIIPAEAKNEILPKAERESQKGIPTELKMVDCKFPYLFLDQLRTRDDQQRRQTDQPLSF